jgi:DNA modification methylase
MGDAREVLPSLPTGSVCSVVTSPPYFRQRQYGKHELEMGREKEPQEYVDALVQLFGVIRPIMNNDGTLWVNIADTYAKDGNLYGVPFQFALAMRHAGWLWRQTIVWSKPDPTPEPVDDRPSTSHEYVFLFAKQRDYYYDIDATRVPHTESTLTRIKYGLRTTHPQDVGGGHNGSVNPQNLEVMGERWANPLGRNQRSVWEVATVGYKGAHYATFPPDLIKPMILAGAPEYGVVLDPFAGSGTVGAVANELSRKALLVELYEEHCSQIMLRAQGVPLGL